MVHELKVYSGPWKAHKTIKTKEFHWSLYYLISSNPDHIINRYLQNPYLFEINITWVIRDNMKSLEVLWQIASN